MAYVTPGALLQHWKAQPSKAVPCPILRGLLEAQRGLGEAIEAYDWKPGMTPRSLYDVLGELIQVIEATRLAALERPLGD